MHTCSDHISACRHDLLHARGLLLPEHASHSRLLLCVTCCRIVSTKESTHHVALVGLHRNIELFSELHHFAFMDQLQCKRQRL